MISFYDSNKREDLLQTKFGRVPITWAKRDVRAVTGAIGKAGPMVMTIESLVVMMVCGVCPVVATGVVLNTCGISLVVDTGVLLGV